MYSTEDLKTLLHNFRDDLNINKKLIDSLHINYADDKTTFNQAIQLYDSCKNKLFLFKL